MADQAQNQQEVQEDNNNKIDKQYNANMEKLLVLFNGEKNIPGKRKVVKQDEIELMINEMLAERQTKTKADFKEKATAIIDKKIEFDGFVVAEKKKFNEIVLKKKEEFNKEMTNLFAMVEDMDVLRKKYRETLQGGGDKELVEANN